MKTCPKCKFHKNESEFYKNKAQKDGLSTHCIQCKSMIDQAHYQKNRQKIIARVSNRDSTRKLERKIYAANYYEQNKANIAKKHREYHIRNFERMTLAQKLYKRQNRDKINTYFRERRSRDFLFKLSAYLRGRTYSALKSKKMRRSNKFTDYIGCSIEELKIYLESKFVLGMSWDNYGKNGWHVDHIRPLSLAKDVDELYSRCHYTNLQPLWAIDNLKKGNRTYGRT